eukprot:scaffold6.g2718.t1
MVRRHLHKQLLALACLAAAALPAASALPEWRAAEAPARAAMRLGSRKLIEAPASSYGPYGARVDQNTVDEILELHNWARMQHATPNVTWNALAAAWAQRWADRCVWGHDLTGERGGAAEGQDMHAYIGNLALVYPGWPSAFKTWYQDELAIYNFSDPGFSDLTGHMTALLWKDTGTVGCASAECEDVPVDGVLWTGTYFVCYYYIPGEEAGVAGQGMSNVDSPEYFRRNVMPKVRDIPLDLADYVSNQPPKLSTPTPGIGVAEKQS